MDVVLALLAVVAAFYFILLRPVLNQQRQRRREVATLDVGDEVLTAGGFYATVTEIRTSDEGPMEILLEVAPGVTLRATAEAVQRVTTPAADMFDDVDDVDDVDDFDHADHADHSGDADYPADHATEPADRA